MKVYTKKGDKGETSLIGGSRILKSDLRIEVYGTIDELNSFIGYLCDNYDNQNIKEQLIKIQSNLFLIEAQIATEPDLSKRKYTVKEFPKINDQDILYLENKIDEMTSKLKPLKNFILPSGHKLISLSHVCRTICRRSERLLIKLNIQNEDDMLCLSYLNRLSDYFFTLSRFAAFENNVKEIEWKSKNN